MAIWNSGSNTSANIRIIDLHIGDGNDFALDDISLAKPDLAATSIAWNIAQGGVDFGYTISGAELIQPTTAALYWSTDTTFDVSQDTLIPGSVTTTQTAVRTDPYPVHVTASTLGTPPAGAKYLLAVVDPNNTLAESDETNNVRALALADVLPSVTVNDLSIVEGNSGTKNAVFIVSLSAPPIWDTILNYATADGTATAGQDYVATTGKLTIPHGSTSATISVPIIGDTMNEADETFFINLSNPTNATIADGQGRGTILNDDPPPRLSVNNVSLTEGNAGTKKNAMFTVKLSAVSGQTVSVPWRTADGTAIAGSDYTATLGTIVFAPGATSLTIAVPILGDTTVERDEFFYVDLGTPTNAVLSVPTGTGTILNDDNTITIGDVILLEGNSGTTAFNFVVTLSAPATFPITVNYATSNGTATAGSDYTAIPITPLVFAGGETSKTVTVVVTGDPAIEPDETFFVNLSAPVNASIANPRGTGRILDDDLSLSINDVRLPEGNSGTTAFTFTVSLSAPAPFAVTVKYATADGTAAAPTDYTARALTTLTFAAGETSKPVTVSVKGDTLIEPDETFFVNLSSPANAVIARGLGVGTILNDDPAMRINDVLITEGNSGTTMATFTISLSSASDRDVSVQYATANGTATGGSDYTPASGMATIPAGTTSITVQVPIVGDPSIEPDETFFVNLSNSTNATIVDGQGQGTIRNDDNLITIGDVTLAEGNSGTTAFNFLVTLSTPAPFPITVNYATSNGTATAGSDYTAIPLSTLVFAPGETSKTVTVAVTGDPAIEPDETFFVNLSAPVNASIARPRGTGKILNDDLSLTINDVTHVEGSSGTTTFTFTVSLSASAPFPVTVKAATANGTATAPSDYTAVGLTTLTFNPGETSKVILIAVKGDTVVEPDEMFFLNLSAPTNAVIGRAQGVGTIANDDIGSLAVDRLTSASWSRAAMPAASSIGDAASRVIPSFVSRAKRLGQVRPAADQDLDAVARELAAMIASQGAGSSLPGARPVPERGTSRRGLSLLPA